MGRFGLLILLLSIFRVGSIENECTPIYVRWPRVRLNLTSRVTGSYSLEESANACSKDEHPGRPGYPLQCSGFNHKHGANNLANDCQLFQKDQISTLDGNVEYDDRYSFYWKYCVKAKEPCKSPYHYDFHIDRYMDYNESKRRILTFQVEDCLDQCLQEKSFECRSVSFNRTAGYCYLSEESRLSKPTSVRVNSNPNYRIDYYENKCHNDCFTFHHECQQNGVMVSVESKFPYTGAMYGLYDFFSCRIEPKEETKFQYFFPFASISKNCSDSMSIRDGEYVLEVVLSTDNVIPLYFLTDEDLIYKAKCPADGKTHYSGSTIGAQVELVPPFSNKVEPVSRLALDVSTTSAPASSSVANASVENTTTPTLAHENATLSLDILQLNATNTTEEDGLAKNTTEHPEREGKKPLQVLPSLDLQPSISKPEERQGNKITLFVRYPKEDNETLPMASNETRHEGTTSRSTAVASSSSTSSTLKSTFRTTTEAESEEKEGSGSGSWADESTTSAARSTSSSTSSSTEATSTTESTTSGSSTSGSTSTNTESTSTSSQPSSSSSSSSASSTPSSTSSSSSSQPSSSSSSSTTTKSFTPSSTTITSSTSTSSSTTETSTQSSTEASSTVPTTTEEDDELHIVHVPYTESTASPSTTFPTWLYAWHFQLVSSTTTAKPSLDTDEPSLLSSLGTLGPGDPALSIDTSVLGIEKPKDVDSSATALSPTYASSASPSSSSTPSSTTVTNGSTRSTTESTASTSASSTTSTISNTPFWPFILRTRSSTIWRAFTESSTDTSTTTPSTTVNTSTDGNVTTNSTSTSTSTTLSTPVWNGTEGPKDLNQTNSTVDSNSSTSTTTLPTTTTTNRPRKKIQFDVHHNGQAVSAVVVGSRITLSFSPSLSIPGSYMSLVGCQVEPINSPYAWEREPLPIVRDGCHSDGVGLVCPPTYTDTGVKVEMEAFRYTTTGEVLYSCLIRVCPYGPCPQPVCGTVDGCNGIRRAPNLSISPTFPNGPIGFGRKKRQETTVPVLSFLPINTDLHANLVSLAGDHVITKRLVVVNSDTELQYYLRTGNVPSPTNAASLNGFLGR